MSRSTQNSANKRVRIVGTSSKEAPVEDTARIAESRVAGPRTPETASCIPSSHCNFPWGPRPQHYNSKSHRNAQQQAREKPQCSMFQCASTREGGRGGREGVSHRRVYHPALGRARREEEGEGVGGEAERGAIGTFWPQQTKHFGIKSSTANSECNF